MNTRHGLAVFLTVLTFFLGGFADAHDSSLPDTAERNFLKDLLEWELAKTDSDDALDGLRWQFRSRHFVFGMPRLVDDRHNFKPQGFTKNQPGVTVLIREAFVIAHFDRMKAPLWVAQRWTKHDFTRMNQVPSQGRPWREDLELPIYARGGTSYDGATTKLDRGHMARHAMNRAWGIDSSNWGSKMSNSAPQHRRINRFNSAWQKLEDEIRDVVNKPDSDIEAVWIISGTIYRDETNPTSETPEEDFQEVVRITDGKFGVPDATYKIVGWFDSERRFQARAFVFEQPHTVNEANVTYSLGNTQAPLKNHLVKIDKIEARTGLNFFPMLRDDIENLIEQTQHQNLWGTE